MKPLIFLFVFGLVGSTGFAQTQFQVLVERPNEKSLKGILSREAIQNDTSFKWYAEGIKGYTPNKDALNALKMNKDSLQLIVFMGTWCEDSHVIIPKLFTLLDAAGFSANNVSLFGVDRQKKSLGHLTEALNIINVPTIIVMKNGKEAGRVVEYGKYGLFDKEMGEIIRSIK